jgi:hypothetical protein
MSGRAAFVAALGCLLLLASGSRAGAQGNAVLVLPRDDPFPAAPEIFVRAVGFADSLGPFRVRLRLALDPTFGLVLYDSTIARSDARFELQRLLPENRDIYAEASVLDRNGIRIAGTNTLAGRTGPRLILVSPPGRTSISLNTRTPRFAWRAASVTLPPGPWIYELFITNVATGETRSQLGITDTVFTWRDTLQANTSYRWRVVARLANGLPIDSAVASSASSFVIAPSDAPVTTLLYQNFPNPFPAPSSSTTCFWFDLQSRSHVELTIHDIRGHRVRTMVPGQLPAELPSGRYGRMNEIDASGCDPRLAWDGTADDGRVVPAGVYLVRLKTDAMQSSKKIVFRGR